MVFGVGPNGVYLTNPLESVSEDLVSEQLCRDIRWTFVQFLSYQSGRDIGHWLWILLLLAGDVERNPGPKSADKKRPLERGQQVIDKFVFRNRLPSNSSIPELNDGIEAQEQTGGGDTDETEF